ncbi:MAG: SusC/RagA family TonB-linked outer membrane protein [Prevotella sp.]|nr:SusC/RagA family TonB-linked outer membrane protein [Prevotella sp.]
MRNVKQNFSRVLSLALLLMMTTIAWAQQRITGTVTDSKGEALIGVSVKQAGTTNGTTTNINGQFTLSVPQGSNLEISYIGYNSQTVRAREGMRITMQEDNQLLDEVVVVGYGTMRRKDVTSSITTVQAKDLNQGVFADPASMLQGKVAGLSITTNGDPNGTPSITLRGVSSLREGAAMEPYYVIDGIPGVDISMVAPDDIETIDVLRDASATAIYGSKAANGVIIITTKSGLEGRTNVSYNGYVAVDQVAKTLDMASADDIRGFLRDNNITGYSYDKGGDTDWQDEVLRTGISHNHNVSINGGAGKTKYMASANYMNRQGVIEGTHMNRLNVRSLISSSILKDHLDISLGMNAMYGKHVGVPMDYFDDGRGSASVLDAMNYFNPTNPIRNADGTWSTGEGSANYNPLSMINEDTSETMWKRNQFIGKATLHIIDGLDWNANYSFGHRQSTFSSYRSHFTQITPYNDYNGTARRNTYFGDEQTFETYLNFDRTFARVHKLALMAGYSWEERNSNDGFGLWNHNYFDDYLKWHNMTYAGAMDGQSAVESGTKETVRNISFYGRLSYSYNSRYMLQATIRRDGSSVFAPGHRWGTFPSVSAAWNITEENFMKNQNFFDQLKLRVGYGISGNALGFGAYSGVATYGAFDGGRYRGTFDYQGNSWAILGATKLPNPDLKWESTAMFNVGLDYAFWNNRINGSIEFYHKKTKDLIWSYPVSTVLYPFNNIQANVGEITNRGVEFTINIDAIRTRNFNWMTTLNLAHNKNVVDKLSNEKFRTQTFGQGDARVAGVSANGYTQNVMEGEALGTFFLYEFAGYDNNGKASYYVRDADGNKTGEITNEPAYKDRYVAGTAQPKLNFGWNNTLTYKNWNATMFFTGVLGNKIYNGTRAHYMSRDFFDGGKNVLKEFITDRPYSDNLSNIPSDRFLEKGDYLRLQTLSIGYTFRKLGGWAESLQLYATCNNVFTITGYKGIDPEVNMGGIAPGVDYRWSNYPHTRTFMFGVKINFASGNGSKAVGNTVYVTDNAEIDRLRAENEALRNRLPEKEIIENNKVVTFPYLVNFVIGETEVVNRERVNLETLASMMKATPEKKYSVVGYADKQTGSAEKNRELAQGRAQNVYDILTKQFGVKPSQLVMDSKGGVDLMYLDDPQLSRSVIISEVK